MVLAHETVEEGDRPEPDQAQEVAVYRRPDNDGNHVVNYRHSGGREPVAEDVVPVEPLPGHVVNPCKAAGRETREVRIITGEEDGLPHHIPGEIEHRHPYHRPHDVPEGDV